MSANKIGYVTDGYCPIERYLTGWMAHLDVTVQVLQPKILAGFF